jgi:hypothetical protein
MSHRPAHDPGERLNEHHPDDLLAIVRAFGGHPDATSARAERIDREGIDLTIRTPQGPATARVAFVEPSGIRMAFRTLARAAGYCATTCRSSSPAPPRSRCS